MTTVSQDFGVIEEGIILIDPPTIFVVRHGNRIDFVDPEWSTRSRRPSDPVLSPCGRTQAEEVSKHPDLQPSPNFELIIFCSPFVRCLETVRPLCLLHNTTINVEYSVMEYFDTKKPNPTHADLPLTIRQLAEVFPELINTRYTPFMPHSETAKCCGESRSHLETRVGRFIHHVVSRTPKFSHGKEVQILIVSHAAGCLAAAETLLGVTNEEENFKTRVGCAAVSKYEHNIVPTQQRGEEVVEGKRAMRKKLGYVRTLNGDVAHLSGGEMFHSDFGTPTDFRAKKNEPEIE